MRQIAITEASLPNPANKIIVLVNTNGKGHGGETLGNYITIMSNGDEWYVLMHEMGHAIGHLLDEYSAEGGTRVYEGPPYSHANSTTVLDRYKVPWSGWIDPATPVPTPYWFTPKNGIGLYVGGNTYAKGTYKPSWHCRMNDHHDGFCQVCKDYMTLLLNEKNPDPNLDTVYGRSRKSNLTVGLDTHALDLGTDNFNIRTFGFTLHNSDPGLLLPMEKKPLPFLTPPNPYLDFSNYFIAETYDKAGPKRVQQISNPFLLRSFPAKGKKGIHQVSQASTSWFAFPCFIRPG